MADTSFLEPLFRAIDAMDASAFAAFLTEDGSFRFGNGPAARGRDAVREGVAAFFRSVRGLEHRILGVWEVSEVVFCQGEVTYTRHDGSDITLPFLNLFRMEGGRIREYLVYADVTPVFAPADR